MYPYAIFTVAGGRPHGYTISNNDADTQHSTNSKKNKAHHQQQQRRRRRRLKYMKCEVKAGEALWVPSYWWHEG
jgi:hypothetical protein